MTSELKGEKKFRITTPFRRHVKDLLHIGDAFSAITFAYMASGRCLCGRLALLSMGLAGLNRFCAEWPGFIQSESVCIQIRGLTSRRFDDVRTFRFNCDWGSTVISSFGGVPE